MRARVICCFALAACSAREDDLPDAGASSDAGIDAGAPDAGEPECVAHADCASGVCNAGTCSAPACDDRVANGLESDVDCGGPECARCPIGAECAEAADCETSFCSGAGACRPPSCFDGALNGLETDLDCGGECDACADGAGCAVAGDCTSGVCSGGACAAPSCTDLIHNGRESDVDCGWPSCGPCADGAHCLYDIDCLSEVCSDASCTAPSCTDRTHNGAETDVDCGGPDCSACGDGLTCALGTDCASAICTDLACAIPTCTDGVRNGTESDIDCGGTCASCRDGARCVLGTDCRSLVCGAGSCVPPTCADGVHNGAETGVDCGGPTCGLCPNGEGCGVAEDCVSGTCTADGRCAPPSCEDGALSSDESDLDCGGPWCARCADGASCRAGSDCRSAFCEDARCLVPVESLCSDGLDEDRDGATDCADSNCWATCYPTVATGRGYRVYRVPFAHCSVLAGWHGTVAYSDVGEGGWWTTIPEAPLDETTMNNCLATQATWGSDGQDGVQAIVADFGADRPVSQVLVGGETVTGWGATTSWLNGATLDYYDGTTWHTLLTLSDLAWGAWYLVALDAPVTARQVRAQRIASWLATNNFRVGHQRP